MAGDEPAGQKDRAAYRMSRLLPGLFAVALLMASLFVVSGLGTEMASMVYLILALPSVALVGFLVPDSPVDYPSVRTVALALVLNAVLLFALGALLDYRSRHRRYAGHGPSSTG